MSSFRRHVSAAPSQNTLDDQEPHFFRWNYSEFDDSNFRIRGRNMFFIIVVFAVMLLITLIFLYARWVCRFGPRPIQSTHAPPPPAPQGLDPVALDSIPVTVYPSHRIDIEADCPICLGIFQDGEMVKVLPQCRHGFHSECVDKWLRTRSNCPLCRSSLRFDSPV